MFSLLEKTFILFNFIFICFISRRPVSFRQKVTKFVMKILMTKSNKSLVLDSLITFLKQLSQLSKGLFTRHDFVACDKFTTGPRHDLQLNTLSLAKGQSFCQKVTLIFFVFFFSERSMALFCVATPRKPSKPWRVKVLTKTTSPAVKT